MENITNNKARDFIKSKALKLERNLFAVRIVATTIGYAGITFWLNAIRANASLWLVWVMIIIQFALYFSIFIAGYRRVTICGLNRSAGIIIFAILAILGRVNDWELVVIPLTVIAMLIVSTKSKNIHDNEKHLLRKCSNKKEN